MRYQEIVIWSGGNEKAKTAKTEAIMSAIACMLFCFLIVLFFVSDFGKEDVKLWEHLLSGIGFGALSFWIPLGLFLMTKDYIEDIKLNKLITLHIYYMEDFIKLGKIPEDKFIVFSNKQGTVLGNKIHEKETKRCCHGVDYLSDFIEYKGIVESRVYRDGKLVEEKK